MKEIELKAPLGKSGLAVVAWGQLFAVAANWAQASDPVLVLNKNGDGWDQQENGLQVAWYRHDATRALRMLLYDFVLEVDSPDTAKATEDTLDDIMEDAVRIYDTGEDAE